VSVRHLRPLLLLFFAALAACAAKAPPAPPPKPPEAPPPTPPPPPPKCETLEEACLAKAGQRLTIAPIDWTVEPPTGWKYASSAGAVIAASDTAVLLIKTIEVPADKKPAAIKARNAKRDELLTAVLGELKLGRPKKLSFSGKPQKSSKVEGVEVGLYQFDGSARSGEPGPLLVFLAQPENGRMLMGVAFVAERDTTNADAAMLKAIASLARAPRAAQSGDAGSPDAG
jgi:hypothetical protein